jgi:small GTP-binding protein
MLENYLEEKNKYLNLIEKLDYYTKNYGDQKQEELLNEQNRKLKKSHFNLSVLGQFKRGKSTLINALLGEDILPTGVLPLTAIITSLHYSENKRAEVIFNNGETKTINYKDIYQYVTEKENPQNCKEIKEVDIYYPSPLLKKGVILVDTPGIGSIYKNNTEITENYLHRADAVIFVLAVDPPMTEKEMDFLDEVKTIANKVIFVLNKIDIVSENDLKQIIDFSKKAIEDRLDIKKSELEFYPISAEEMKEEAKSKKGETEGFIDALEKMIIKQKGKIIISSVNDKLMYIKEHLLFNIELEIKILDEPLANLEEKVKKLYEKLEKIKTRKKQVVYLFKGEIEEILNILKNDIDELKKKQSKKLYIKAEEELKDLDGRNIQNQIQDFLEKEIKIIFEEWRKEEKEKMDRLLYKESNKFVENINSIIDEIKQIFADLFDLEFFNIIAVDEMAVSKDFYYHIKDLDLFYPKLDILTFSAFLPGFIKKPIIKNQIKEEVIKQVDKNCGRINYDFKKRIEQSSKEFISNWEKEVDNLIGEIKNIIEKSQREKEYNEDKISDKKNKLLTDLKELKRLS